MPVARGGEVSHVTAVLLALGHKKACQVKCPQLSENGLAGDFHFCYLFLLLWLHNTHRQPVFILWVMIQTGP